MDLLVGIRIVGRVIGICCLLVGSIVNIYVHGISVVVVLTMNFYPICIIIVSITFITLIVAGAMGAAVGIGRVRGRM